MTGSYSIAQVVALMAFAWVAGLLLGMLAVIAWRLAHRAGGGPS